VSARWRIGDIPDLAGRRALVTGVTSGLGLVTARELARAGAEVLLAARNPDRLAQTQDALRDAVPGALLVPLELDLADLESVRRGAAEALEAGPLDILVNNAGVMATPRSTTRDGYELQLGTNHFGHFALTGLLMPALTAAEQARVVTVSSLVARSARGVPLTDPRTPGERYRKWECYGWSKLANLLFAFELDRRARRAGLRLVSVAAHPGYTRTNLVNAGLNARGPGVEGAIGLAFTRLVGQGADDGAEPQLRAATDPGLTGGDYLGPSGPFEMRGAPTLVRPPRAAQDESAASALWSLSEESTGVSYP
jgi:NAD(P)-dependent dehydrogenase (short-subunit alcohol dehydrogenase family)